VDLRGQTFYRSAFIRAVRISAFLDLPRSAMSDPVSCDVAARGGAPADTPRPISAADGSD
jgi:hypothetical protein